MDEVASGAVRAVAGRMEGPASFGLVLGVAVIGPQLVSAVCELTLLSILAMTGLLERGRETLSRGQRKAVRRGLYEKRGGKRFTSHKIR